MDSVPVPYFPVGDEALVVPEMDDGVIRELQDRLEQRLATSGT